MPFIRKKKWNYNVIFVILTVFLTGLDKHCTRRGIPSHFIITAAFAGSVDKKKSTLLLTIKS